MQGTCVFALIFLEAKALCHQDTPGVALICFPELKWKRFPVGIELQTQGDLCGDCIMDLFREQCRTKEN